ncbi:hypothetical protein AaE_002640, partial [Aphanomyces astaci]
MSAATASSSYAEATAPKTRVYFPRPSIDEMDEIMTFLRNEGHSVDDSIDFIQARVPYRHIVKTSTLVVDTGTTFAANTAANSIRTLWASMLQATQAPLVHQALRVKVGGITQLNKIPGQRGGFAFSVTDEWRKQLYGQPIVIGGKSFTFGKIHPLDTAFYLDITGTRSTFPIKRVVQALVSLGTTVVYFAHREITEFEQNFGNWRVYFAMDTIPQQLLCHGKSLAFVTVNGFSYPVFCKPSQFERGTRDKQSLDVDVILHDPTHDQSTNNAPSRPADLVPPLSGAEVDLDLSPNLSSDDQVSDVMPPTPPVATVAGDTDMTSRPRIDPTDIALDETSVASPTTPTSYTSQALPAERAQKRAATSPARTEFQVVRSTKKGRQSIQPIPPLSFASPNFFDELSRLSASMRDVGNSERLVSFTPLVTTVPADLVGHLTTQRMAYLPGSKKRVSWDPNHMSLSDLVAVLETETNKANALDPTTLHTEALAHSTAAYNNLTASHKLDHTWSHVNRFPHAAFLALDEVASTTGLSDVIRLHQLYRHTAATFCTRDTTFSNRINTLCATRPTNRDQLLTLLQ